MLTTIQIILHEIDLTTDLFLVSLIPHRLPLIIKKLISLISIQRQNARSFSMT